MYANIQYLFGLIFKWNWKRLLVGGYVHFGIAVINLILKLISLGLNLFLQSVCRGQVLGGAYWDCQAWFYTCSCNIKKNRAACQHWSCSLPFDDYVNTSWKRIASASMFLSFFSVSLEQLTASSLENRSSSHSLIRSLNWALRVQENTSKKQ